jgi:hypothetical protein
MTIALLAPLGLAALTALALPILIHLVRRIELKTTDFAALRWISERVNPRRRIRFERPWLLLLRLFLLALLALLLARPATTEPAGPQQAWVVVAPGVSQADARAAFASDMPASWHWLAPGFPSMETAATTNAVPLASLLRELDAELPSTSALTVIVPNEIAGLDGERLRLAHETNWLIAPGRMDAAAPVVSNAPIRIAVRHAPQDESVLRYLRAAVAAWNAREPDRYTLDAQPSSAPIGDDESWLIWLDGEPPAAISSWVERGGVALLAHHPLARGTALWRDATGKVLATSEASGRGHIIALPDGLTPQALPLLLDADFPDRLLGAFRNPPLPPTRAAADAMRPTQGSSMVAADARALASARPLDSWLVLLIAATFLLERIVATRTHTESPE